MNGFSTSRKLEKNLFQRLFSVQSASSQKSQDYLNKMSLESLAQLALAMYLNPMHLS